VDFGIPKKNRQVLSGGSAWPQKDLTGKTPEKMPLARALEDKIA
jgi:hypothetical protein